LIKQHLALIKFTIAIEITKPDNTTNRVRVVGAIGVWHETPHLYGIKISCLIPGNSHRVLNEWF
jgi:hypothetical protein